MTSARVIRDYIQHKRSLGMVFGVEEVVLRSFCKAAGNSDIAKVSAETVRRFLDGTGPVTGFWSPNTDCWPDYINTRLRGAMSFKFLCPPRCRKCSALSSLISTLQRM